MCARPLASGRFDADKGGGGPGGGRYAAAAAVEEEKEGPLLDGASRGGGEGAGAIANVRYSYLFRMNRSSSELRSSPESAGGGLHRSEVSFRPCSFETGGELAGRLTGAFARRGSRAS